MHTFSFTANSTEVALKDIKMSFKVSYIETHCKDIDEADSNLGLLLREPNSYVEMSLGLATQLGLLTKE